jgi:hypothetical protein
MIETAPVDAVDHSRPAPTIEPGATAVRPIEHAEVEPFGELGPVLVGALVLWIAIVVAVAGSVS